MKTILRIFLLITLLSTLSIADIINVPADIDSIQGGINLASDGDTVLVDIGTYFENINFNGKNITVGSLFLTTNDRSFISKTIIDGNQNSSVVRIDNGEDTTAVLCGFTITNGVGGKHCWRTGCSYWAGGIRCENSSPKFTDLLIIENMGGGISLSYSNPILIGVTIKGNVAEEGSGIYIGRTSYPYFDNVNRCNIYSNYATRGSDLYSSNETLNIKVVVDTFTVISPTNFHAYPINKFTFDILNAKIEQSNSDLFVNPNGNNNNCGLSWEEPLQTIQYAQSKLFADSLNPHTIYLANGEYINDLFVGSPIQLLDYVTLSGESKSGVIFSTENFGSPIFSFKDSKSVSLENLTIIGARDTRAIFCDSSNPIIKNVTINGAFILLTGANPYIEKVKISGNLVEAGILMYGSSPTLMNVEITDNSGWLSGGLRVECGSHANLINCTISNNKSQSEDWGGINVQGSSLTIVNSIIWGKSLYEIGVNSGDEFSIKVTNSLIKNELDGIHHWNEVGTVYWLGGNIDLDPNFIDAANMDYRLKEGSPCIDAGIQDTFLVYNDSKDTLFIPAMDYIGLAPDIGAYEYGDPLAIEQETIKLPKRYSLSQNYPNPYNPSTTIEFSLPHPEYTTLKIYNLLGAEVATLVSDKLQAGIHKYQFDASQLASGVYYYQITAGDYREVKKMILLK